MKPLFRHRILLLTFSVMLSDGFGDVALAELNTGIDNGPIGVSITPDGAHVYVSNYKSNSVSVLNTITHRAIATEPVENLPWP